MAPIINELDIAIVRALERGETPFVSSTHKVRLEMMNLVTDGPGGLRLVPGAQKATWMVANAKPEEIVVRPRKLTANGHKRKFGRVLPAS